MPELVTYLTFDGNCEAAFNFYKSVFGGEFAMISRFGEMPPTPECQLSNTDKQRVMHVSYPIGEGANLMGSDTMSNMPKVIQGNNFPSPSTRTARRKPIKSSTDYPLGEGSPCRWQEYVLGRVLRDVHR